MGWLTRILGATPKEDLRGIRLDTRAPFWELDGKTDFPRLLRALPDLLSDGSTLYFEGGSPNRKMLDFFRTSAVPEQSHVAVGTLWPKPSCRHVPATPPNLSALAEIAESCAEPELATHFHVYRNGKVLLEWHDAFTQPMLLADDLPEDRVRAFARTLSMTCTRTEGER